MVRSFRVAALALLCIVACAPFTASVASAHGHVEVGNYEIEIGFSTEPAYQGEPNGLDLFVTNTTTDQPVNDLADTLQAELTYGSATLPLEIEPKWGEEGAYTAYVIPTRTGAYTWRIFGTIEDTPVDISMTGGPDTFAEIQPKSALSFPAAEPTTDELAAQIGQARAFGIAGLVVGALGLLAAAIALFRRPATAAQPRTQRQQV